MSATCYDHTSDPHRGNPSYRRVLWAVLCINAAMFAVEVVAGLAAGSASLQADALDFLGDAGNYAISLFVVGMALRYRATAALAKGVTMGLFGLWVIATVVWHAARGTCRVLSRWVASAPLHSSPTLSPSAFYGHTELVTRTCAQPGCALGMMCLEI